MFKSFFLGGFECSTHRRHDGVRVDVIHSSFHEQRALEDYRILASQGIRTVRDGVRWHLVETTPYKYDWSSVMRQIQAARTTRTQVLWDVFHYGWPDGLDLWSAKFVDQFAAFSRAFATLILQETGPGAFFTPVNEISFMAFAAGEHGFFFPYARQRGER